MLTKCLEGSIAEDLSGQDGSVHIGDDPVSHTLTVPIPACTILLPALSIVTALTVNEKDEEVDGVEVG